MNYIKLIRGEKAEWLIENYPKAFLLLTLIALRARRTTGGNLDCKIGEALIGDYKKSGLSTEKEYRCAKKILEKFNFGAFKGATNGTVARLTSKEIFDINEEMGRTEGQARGGRGATNKNERMKEYTPLTPLTNADENSGREEKVKPLPAHLYPLAVYLLAMETVFVNYDQLRLAINRYIHTSRDLSCYTVPQLCFALWTAMKRQKADPVGYTVHLETVAKCILEANRFEPRGEAKVWCDDIQKKFEGQKDILLTSHSPLLCPPKTQ